MISIIKTDNIKRENEKTVLTGELAGLSTDEKLTEINGQAIGNGSTLIEMDTGTLFFYDQENEEWKEV